MNVQTNQEIDTVESSLSKELDGFNKKFYILQQSISPLTNQLVHQEEENLEEECLIDTTVEEQCKQQDEAISPLLIEEGSGKDAMEGTQEPILQPIPVNWILMPLPNPKTAHCQCTSCLHLHHNSNPKLLLLKLKPSHLCCLHKT